MKLLMIIFTALLLFSAMLVKSQQTLTSPSVICYDGKEQILPASWLGKKTKAKATAADTAKFHTDTAAVNRAFDKYPSSVLKKDLGHVYIVGKLKFNGQFFTGTNSTTDIYIGSEGNNEIEKTFHHEFSSILLRNYASYTMESDWKQLSPSLRNSSSAASVKAGLFSTSFDSVLCEKGYLSPYSLSNWENDFNMYAENLFAGGADFWKIVDKYPSVKAKLNLVLALYKKVWGGFSENYFRFLADDDGSYYKKLVDENQKKQGS